MREKYKTGDIEIPSVTELLPKQDFFMSPEKLELIRVEGVDNHSFVKYFLDTGDTLGEEYLEKFSEFLKLNSEEIGDVVKYETRLYSEKYMFCGQPDIITDRAIVDIKRSVGVSKYQSLQLAGYNILCGNKFKKWLIIYLKDDEFKMKNVYNSESESVFLALVNNYWNSKRIDEYFKKRFKGDIE